MQIRPSREQLDKTELAVSRSQRSKCIVPEAFLPTLWKRESPHTSCSMEGGSTQPKQGLLRMKLKQLSIVGFLKRIISKDLKSWVRSAICFRHSISSPLKMRGGLPNCAWMSPLARWAVLFPKTSSVTAFPFGD